MICVFQNDNFEFFPINFYYQIDNHALIKKYQLFSVFVTFSRDFFICLKRAQEMIHKMYQINHQFQYSKETKGQMLKWTRTTGTI